MDALENFLRTDPRDVGCDGAMAALHVYADLTAAGHEPADILPGLAAHLAACGSCAEDLTGLLAAMTSTHIPAGPHTDQP